LFKNEPVNNIAAAIADRDNILKPNHGVVYKINEAHNYSSFFMSRMPQQPILL
jgi:hypothetical protein